MDGSPLAHQAPAVRAPSDVPPVLTPRLLDHGPDHELGEYGRCGGHVMEVVHLPVEHVNGQERVVLRCESRRSESH
eukprot:6454912-Alexandrium_andersonii.AAC.1